jgi:hypothetical protein
VKTLVAAFRVHGKSMAVVFAIIAIIDRVVIPLLLGMEPPSGWLKTPYNIAIQLHKMIPGNVRSLLWALEYIALALALIGVCAYFGYIQYLKRIQARGRQALRGKARLFRLAVSSDGKEGIAEMQKFFDSIHSYLAQDRESIQRGDGFTLSFDIVANDVPGYPAPGKAFYLWAPDLSQSHGKDIFSNCLSQLRGCYPHLQTEEIPPDKIMKLQPVEDQGQPDAVYSFREGTWLGIQRWTTSNEITKLGVDPKVDPLPALLQTMYTDPDSGVELCGLQFILRPQTDEWKLPYLHMIEQYKAQMALPPQALPARQLAMIKEQARHLEEKMTDVAFEIVIQAFATCSQKDPGAIQVFLSQVQSVLSRFDNKRPGGENNRFVPIYPQPIIVPLVREQPTSGAATKAESKENVVRAYHSPLTPEDEEGDELRIPPAESAGKIDPLIPPFDPWQGFHPAGMTPSPFPSDLSRVTPQPRFTDDAPNENKTTAPEFPMPSHQSLSQQDHDDRSAADKRPRLPSSILGLPSLASIRSAGLSLNTLKAKLAAWFERAKEAPPGAPGGGSMPRMPLAQPPLPSADQSSGDFSLFPQQVMSALELIQYREFPDILPKPYDRQGMGLITSSELSIICHLPDKNVQVPGLRYATARKLDPPRNITSKDYLTPGKVTIGKAGDGYLQISIESMRQHFHILGPTGCGKCVAASSKVLIPDTGEWLPIAAVVAEKRARLVTLSSERRCCSTEIRAHIMSGHKDVVKVTTEMGRELLCTPEHPLLTRRGWMPLSTLRPDSRIAAATWLPFFGSHRPTATALKKAQSAGRKGRVLPAVFTFSKDSLREYLMRSLPSAALPGMRLWQGASVDDAEAMQHLLLRFGILVRREGTELRTVTEYSTPLLLRQQIRRSSVAWERIVSIEPAGTEDVYDLEVPETHCFFAQDLVVHNSTLLQNMVLQLIEQGYGVGVIEPKGDLVRDIAERIPTEREQDVVFFRADEMDMPMGLNIIACPEESRMKDFVKGQIIGVIRDNIQGAAAAPRAMNQIQDGLDAILDAVENPNLNHLRRFFADRDYRAEVVQNLRDPQLQQEWLSVLEMTPAKQDELLQSATWRLKQLTQSTIARNILAQPFTTFDMREIIDAAAYQGRGKIFLAHIPTVVPVGSHLAALLGRMIITQFIAAAFRLAGMPEHARPDFVLFVDEFQQYVMPDIRDILDMGRSYHFCLCMSHQYLTQVKNGDVLDSILGNVRNNVVYNLESDDATVFAKLFGDQEMRQDFRKMEKYSTYVRLLTKDGVSGPYSVKMLPPPPKAR